MSENIGIFGGTFDPPHLGHLILAAEALNQLQLTRVLWVISPQPPHKTEQTITAMEHRLEMLKQTILNSPGFELSMIEFSRPAPHYTVDTLDLLQSKYPAARLILLLGGDSLHDLPTWNRSNELLYAVHSFGVMRRPGDSIDMPLLESRLPGITARLRFFETPQLEISSSVIRQRIQTKGHFRYYLPTGVYDYIQKNALYRAK